MRNYIRNFLGKFNRSGSGYTIEKNIKERYAGYCYYETKAGNYYLPDKPDTDAVMNCMKAGQIFEPEIVDIARKYIRPGTSVLDIGANFGQMSIAFSKFAGTGKVYSFEADDFVFGFLKKNIIANSCDNIVPVFGAVYEKDGLEFSFPVPDFERFGSLGSYGIDVNNTDPSVRKVKSITIDSLQISEPISFMKVDVQGSDLFAMKGAVNTIQRNRMPVIFEFEEQFQREFNTSFDEYIKFTDDIGYKVTKKVLGINYLILPK